MKIEQMTDLKTDDKTQAIRQARESSGADGKPCWLFWMEATGTWWLSPDKLHSGEQLDSDHPVWKTMRAKAAEVEVIDAPRVAPSGKQRWRVTLPELDESSVEVTVVLRDPWRGEYRWKTKFSTGDDRSLTFYLDPVFRSRAQQRAQRCLDSPEFEVFYTTTYSTVELAPQLVRDEPVPAPEKPLLTLQDPDEPPPPRAKKKLSRKIALKPFEDPHPSVDERQWTLEHEPTDDEAIRTWHWFPDGPWREAACGRDPIPGSPLLAEAPEGFEVCQICMDLWRRDNDVRKP